jgi:hypothetical protein
MKVQKPSNKLSALNFTKNREFHDIFRKCDFSRKTANAAKNDRLRNRKLGSSLWPRDKTVTYVLFEHTSLSCPGMDGLLTVIGHCPLWSFSDNVHLHDKRQKYRLSI